jgi:transcriptional regulator
MPEHEATAMLAAIEAADLVTSGPDGMIATFLPMLFVPAQDSSADLGVRGVLQGHVARNNPHVAAARASQQDSLVITRGPDGYISPRFYASKAEHGRVVPTWNYTTVQVYGRLTVHDEPEWLRDLVTRLTDRHESSLSSRAGSVDPAGRWFVTDAPSAFIDGQLRAIVGLELQISRVEAKSKMSQNRPPADRLGVVEGLRAVDRGDPVASAVEAASALG